MCANHTLYTVAKLVLWSQLLFIWVRCLPRDRLWCRRNGVKRACQYICYFLLTGARFRRKHGIFLEKPSAVGSPLSESSYLPGIRWTSKLSLHSAFYGRPWISITIVSHLFELASFLQWLFKRFKFALFTIALVWTCRHLLLDAHLSPIHTVTFVICTGVHPPHPSVEFKPRDCIPQYICRVNAPAVEVITDTVLFFTRFLVIEWASQYFSEWKSLLVPVRPPILSPRGCSCHNCSTGSCFLSLW